MEDGIVEPPAIFVGQASVRETVHSVGYSAHYKFASADDALVEHLKGSQSLLTVHDNKLLCIGLFEQEYARHG